MKELDNRGSNYFIALYWAEALTARDPSWSDLATALKQNQEHILKDLTDCQGSKQDIGGYYRLVIFGTLFRSRKEIGLCLFMFKFSRNANLLSTFKKETKAFTINVEGEELRFRAGHFRYFFIFSIIKNDFFCIFYEDKNYFCTSPILKSPLPVKLT